MVGASLVLAFVITQYLLFRQYALREVVWAYPTQFDQAASLRRSYETYEAMRREGIAAGVLERLAQPAPTGVLLPIEAALLSLLLGPSRLTALTVSFLHLAAFEVALFWGLRFLSGRGSVAALGLGLFLCARAPFAPAGGLFDFRMDMIALSLFGIFMGVALRSGVFADRWLSLAAGAVAGILVLVRFLALAYLAATLLVVLAFLLWRRERGGAARAGGPIPRSAYLCAAALTMAALAGPALLANLDAMRDYYGFGHFVGVVRQFWMDQQRLSLLGHLLYYPRSLAQDYAGWLLLGMATLAVLAAAALGRRSMPLTERPAPVEPVTAALFVSACLLAPMATLTVHAVKSSVAASILVAPLVWLAAFAVVRLARAERGHPLPPRVEGGLAGLAAVALLAGIGYQAVHLRGHGPLSAHRQDMQGLLALYDTIGQHSRRMGWRAPRVSTDRLSDFLNPGIVPAVVYERQGLLLGYNGGLGSLIFPVSEADALSQASASDFVVVTDDGPDLGPYPFEASMRPVRPALRRLCAERFDRLGDFRFFGRQATLYARPERP